MHNVTTPEGCSSDHEAQCHQSLNLDEALAFHSYTAQQEASSPQNEERASGRLDPQTDAGGVIEAISDFGQAFSDDEAVRINNQRLLLTYDYVYLPKDSFKKWFKEKAVKTYATRLTFLEMAHEKGPRTGMPHTHVLINFGTRFQLSAKQYKDIRRFDYLFEGKNYHPNLQLITTDLHWRNAVKYLTKSDPENGHLKKTDKPQVLDVQAIWQCKSPSEALLKFAKRSQEASGIILIYNHRPEPVQELIELKHPWQEQLKLHIAGEPHPRHILWFFDKMGSSGKSDFTSHMEVIDPEHYLAFEETGPAANFTMNLINSINQKGWIGHCLMLDLPRQFAERTTIYQCLEKVKNGKITGTRYQGGNKRFKKPHVLVFANFLPKTDAMSIDRWRIFQFLEDDQKIPYYKECAITSLGGVCLEKDMRRPRIHLLADESDMGILGRMNRGELNVETSTSQFPVTVLFE